MEANMHPREHPFKAYIRDLGVVLKPEEARVLFKDLMESSAWARRSMRIHGRVVTMPRDMAWYGASKGQGVYGSNPQPWPEALLRAKVQVEELTGFTYNACLCNLYRDGADSVAWHCDKEAYGGAVASLSLGATRIFRVREKKDHRKTFDLPLTNGSLLLMLPGCQENLEHTVPRTKKPIGPRINLTFRQVGF